MSKTEDKKLAVQKLEQLWQLTNDVISRNLALDNRYQILNIVLTVTGSCAIWALIKPRIDIAAYIGAVITSLTTSLNLYRKAFPPEKEIAKAQDLNVKIQEYLREIDKTDMVDIPKFKDKMRQFIYSLTVLKNPYPDRAKWTELIASVSANEFSRTQSPEQMYAILDKIIPPGTSRSSIK